MILQSLTTFIDSYNTEWSGFLGLKRKKEHRQVFELIKNSDIVLEVVDSRFPEISRVSSIEKHIRALNIPLIIVLNKCDLVPHEISIRTKKIFEKEYPTVYISAQNRQGTRKLRFQIVKLCKKKEIIISLVGIPNTGKSSLLNILRGKHVAPTGQKPGITRHKQLVRVSRRILIYDTPGIIPFDHPDDNFRAFLGSFSIEKLEDPILAAYFFLDRIRKNNPKGLIQRYKLPSIDVENASILVQIAQQRGILLKKGRLNIPEAAKLLMREFTAGKIEYWEEIPERHEIEKNLC